MTSIQHREAEAAGIWRSCQHCGICREEFTRLDEVVAVIAEFGRPRLLSITASDTHGEFSRMGVLNGWTLCQETPWPPCAQCPEVVAYHAECYHVFVQTCDAEDAVNRLWRFTIFRKAWKPQYQDPLLMRPVQTLPISGAALEAVATKLGLPELTKIPPEIYQFIRNGSAGAPFWRAAMAIDVAYEAQIYPWSNSYETLPMSTIMPWNRGEEAWGSVLRAAKMPMMRLTFDTFGLKSIERFADYIEIPPSPEVILKNKMFLVMRKDKFSHLKAFSQNGLVRLQPPEETQLWDIPIPPMVRKKKKEKKEKEKEKKDPTAPKEEKPKPFTVIGKLSRHAHIRTIKLENLTGLTFFILHNGEVAGMHGHTAEAPYANHRDIFRARNERLENYFYVYLPLAPGDYITKVGTREKFGGEGGAGQNTVQFAFRTRLAGNVSVGFFVPSLVPAVIAAEEPKMFMYDDNEGMSWMFGILPWLPTQLPQYLLGTSHPYIPEDRPEALGRRPMCFSWVPLGSVTMATVFLREHDDFCAGILFEYENGGKRTVGEVRLGQARERVYMKPKLICTRELVTPDSFGDRYKQDIIFPEEKCADDEDDEGECCHEMDGIMHFWFSAMDTFIEFFPLSEKQTPLPPPLDQEAE